MVRLSSVCIYDLVFDGIDVTLPGRQSPGLIFRLFLRNWKFWIITGSIGFGGFYSLICFSADHAPGWVVAATWQLTIIATLVVLICFGRSFPKKDMGFLIYRIFRSIDGQPEPC